MTRRTWTLPELREARDAWVAGEAWPDVGARYGVSASTIRTQVVRHLGKPRRQRRPPPPDEATLLEAIRIRNTERLSWSLIAQRVGYSRPGGTLHIVCTRYANRHKMTVYKGMPDARRTRWDARTAPPERTS